MKIFKWLSRRYKPSWLGTYHAVLWKSPHGELRGHSSYTVVRPNGYSCADGSVMVSETGPTLEELLRLYVQNDLQRKP